MKTSKNSVTSFDTIRNLFKSNPRGTITAADCVTAGVPPTSARTMLFHLTVRGEIKKTGRGEFRAATLARDVNSTNTDSPETAQVKGPAPKTARKGPAK